MPKQTYPYRLEYAFAGGFDAVEDWVATHAEGEWLLQFGGTDEVRGRTVLKVMFLFELESDRDALKEMLAQQAG